MQMQNVYSRLRERGLSPEEVDYVRRMTKIGVGVPFWPDYFRKHYGQEKSPKEVLSKVEDWERALDNDFLIDEKTKLQIRGKLVLAKYATYNAILGELSPIEYFKIRLHLPGLVAKILSIFGPTAKSHRYIEYMEGFIQRVQNLFDNEVKRFGKTAKKTSKFYDECRGTTKHGPLFTNLLIPLLYEWLFRFYKTAPHRMGPHDDSREYAYYPRDLMKDISDILLTEYPNQPIKLTPDMVKAAISRYLQNQELKQCIKALLEHRFTPSSDDIEKVLKSLKIAKIA